MNNKKINIFFLKIVIFSLLLMPSLEIISILPAVRPEEIILLIWLFFCINTKQKIKINHRILFLFIFILLLPISIANGLTNNYLASLGDFNQIIRFFKYILVSALTYTLFTSLNDVERYNILRFTIIVGLITFLITLQQYMDWFSLNSLYISKVASTQYEGLINGSSNPRPVAMIGNPNELGYMFAILIIISFFNAIINGKIFFYLCTLAFFAGLIITLSRGSFFALLTGLSILYIYFIFKLSLLKKIKTIILIAMIIINSYFSLYIEAVYVNFTWRFENAIQFDQDVSFQARLNNWQENINIIEQHPIIGVGPLRRYEIFRYAADNEWLLVVRSYGLIGAVALILLFIIVNFKKTNGDLIILNLSLSFSAFVYMIPAAVFHSLVLFPFLLILFAFIDSFSSPSQKIKKP